jgi:hypothetical protein
LYFNAQSTDAAIFPEIKLAFKEVGGSGAAERQRSKIIGSALLLQPAAYRARPRFDGTSA